jgi:hypothetical protein
MGKIKPKFTCRLHDLEYVYYCHLCNPEHVPELSYFEYEPTSRLTTYLHNRLCNIYDLEPDLVANVFEYCKQHDISVALVLKRERDKRKAG